MQPSTCSYEIYRIFRQKYRVHIGCIAIQLLNKITLAYLFIECIKAFDIKD